MPRLSSKKLESLVKQSLADFYQRRSEKLSGLRLSDTLKTKNPYLFRAKGVQKASEIVSELLQAYISSSDETMFGNMFFEPIAKIISGGQVGGGEGVDIIREDDHVVTVIAVKSGSKWGNADSWKRQRQNFEALRHRLSKLRKQFDPVMGYGYGRCNTPSTAKRPYRQVSGQAFWEELTGDSDFYLKLIRLMKDYPQKHRQLYQAEWNKAVNRFEREFLLNFATQTGEIDWERLVEFNSSKTKMPFSKSSAPCEALDD